MRHVLIATFAVFVILFTAWRVQHPRTKADRNRISDGMPPILHDIDTYHPDGKKLQGIPILVIIAQQDMRLPTNQQNSALARSVGPSCQIAVVPGAAQPDVERWDNRRIKAFLSAHRRPQQKMVVINSQNIPTKTPSFLSKNEPYDFLTYEVFTSRMTELLPTAMQHTLETRYAKAPAVAFVCQGLGTTAVWRFAEHNPKRVACIVAVYPMAFAMDKLNLSSAQ